MRKIATRLRSNAPNIGKPVNIALPSITGLEQAGEILTAGNGGWNGSPAFFTYQWVSSSTGNIPGATASTYVVAPGDVSLYVTVKVTATNAAGSATASSPLMSHVNVAGVPQPVVSAAPAISSAAPQVGVALAVSNGTWANAPTSHTYQWVASNGNISGATTNAYTPVAADAGKTLTVNVHAVNGAGKSLTAISPPTFNAVVASGLSISGAAQVGQTLTASGGSGGYQWYREGSAISGAASSAYTPQASDIGALIHVESNGQISALAGPVISTNAFYVSNSIGNDSWDGRAPAFTIGTTGPWKTLAKVNAARLAPGSVGTSVLFKRGDTWDCSLGPSVTGQLKPTSSGLSATNQIVFDAYGTGANPIIDGSADASTTGDWQLVPGSSVVWESVQTFPPALVQTATITAGSPASVTISLYAPVSYGQSIVFGGTPPSGITAGKVYYATNSTGSVLSGNLTSPFYLSSTPVTTTLVNTAASGTVPVGISGLPYINANDIGNVLWNPRPLGGSAPSAVVIQSYGVMKGGGAAGVWYKPGDGANNIGTTVGNWNFNTDNFRVQIYTGTTNPATLLTGPIRLAMDLTTVFLLNVSYITIQNFTLQNMADSGVALFGGYPGAIPGSITDANVMKNIIVRDNVIQWCGGGNDGGASQGVAPLSSRYGDGIDYFGTYYNTLVERNFIYEVLDGCITPQPGGVTRNNNTIRNNVMVNYGASIAILDEEGVPNRVSDGLYIYNNTGYNSSCWSYAPVVQRPNGDSQRESFLLNYDATLTVANQDFRNNVFSGMTDTGNEDAFFLSSTTCPAVAGTTATCTLKNGNGQSAAGMWTHFDYNLWSTLDGNPTTYGGAGNPPLKAWFTFHGFEAHGIVDPPSASPQFINTTNDFRPAAGSPFFGAGANLYSVNNGDGFGGVVWDFNKKPRPAIGPFTLGAFQ
ncbi:MAG: hypothetical protein ACREDT_11865 [Methylocella sp.]